MKLDILAMGVHPDDVELSSAGTLLKAKSEGKKIGILDFTQGELGTRGSASLRLEEAAASAKILGLDVRENLGYKDAFFQNDESHQKGIIRMLRRFQPEVVLCNALEDRHPDHGRAAKLTTDACFYSGLRKIATEWEGEAQDAWRPKAVYHYIQDRASKPDFVVDVSEFVEQKMLAIQAFKSQFYNPDSNEPESPLTMQNFFDYIKGRMTDMGRFVFADYAEGFHAARPIGVKSLEDLY